MKTWQLIIDVEVPDDQLGKEPLADALEEFVASYLGGSDKPLPASAVKCWWKGYQVTQD